MDKNRLEALSDGVFSIIMTLLIFNVAVPTIAGTASEADIATALLNLSPLFVSYFMSFAVLAMFWISHNFFYHSVTTEVNRKLVLLNMLYLSFLAFIPFSAHLLGEYQYLKLPVLLYGANVLLIGIIASFILHYAIYSHDIDTSHLDERLVAQARVRSLLTPISTAIGIAVLNFSTPAALILFTFPIIFNLIPGSLGLMERIFKFTL